MTLVVLGVDALDPELVDSDEHPSLTLESHRSIETITSSTGEPSTHELWPTIITGLRPEEHGLVLDEGVAWQNPVLRIGRDVGQYVLTDGMRTRIGAWLLNNTDEDAFREPVTYYEENDIQTVFDGRDSKAIGIPNYVVDPDDEDREHELRKSMGELFERDPDEKGGHTSDDPHEFYELCMEMVMIRVARTRRALRSHNYELVFGYTSGLDLVGHVSYDLPALQERAYDETDDFVGELRDDLGDDELLLVSDHGLQDGVHTHEAMVAGTKEEMVESIDSVTDVRGAVEDELRAGDHQPAPDETTARRDDEKGEKVREQLEDLGYM
ncbi:MAG: alkaline phosphatase family protein [Halobacteriales archaeon]|nr:alkaline phosphatase family protein [Halobacteriales archaeon]